MGCCWVLLGSAWRPTRAFLGAGQAQCFAGVSAHQLPPVAQVPQSTASQGHLPSSREGPLRPALPGPWRPQGQAPRAPSEGSMRPAEQTATMSQYRTAFWAGQAAMTQRPGPPRLLLPTAGLRSSCCLSQGSGPLPSDNLRTTTTY